MPHKTYPTDIAEQGRAVLEAWREIDPALQLGGMALADLEAGLNGLGEIYAQLDSLDAQITELRNRRDDAGVDLWDRVKRVRTGVKSVFGDNSSEYEVIGGTRIDDRKPRGIKKVEEPA
ncbi:MAG: hypothetical protein JXB07_11180 [Anaerolineae bacterium]|nr:hypothetical protein [Anaerolineae bacterium]